MSTTVSTRSPGTLSPTRQQLDELDALLKRMLDLPVNQLEDGDVTEEAEEPPAPPPVQRTPRRVPEEVKSVEESPRRARPARTVEKKASTPPVSYMVVETASPRPIPPASGFEPQPTGLGMRLMPVSPAEESADEEESAASVGEVGDRAQRSDQHQRRMPCPRPRRPRSPRPRNRWLSRHPLRVRCGCRCARRGNHRRRPGSRSRKAGSRRREIPAPAVSPEPIVNPFLALGPTPQEVILPQEPAAAMPDVIVQRIPVGSASHLSQTSTGQTPMPAEAAPSEPRLTLSAEDARRFRPSCCRWFGSTRASMRAWLRWALRVAGCAARPDGRFSAPWACWV